MTGSDVILTRGLTRTYRSEHITPVLTGVDLRVQDGERVAILGGSGAGKSTLLNILGLLDSPDSGSYQLLGKEATSLGHRQRDRLRANALGFVFQAHHVLGHRTSRENVDLKLSTISTPERERAGQVAAALAAVGLERRADVLGRTLSGGEKQRLALARAIVVKPAVLLADEPTGNLDDANTTRILDLFTRQSVVGVSVVVITHDVRVSQWADTPYDLVDGQLQEHCR